MDILVGTSGFAYKEWRGPFYPEKMKEKDMLRYYAERLGTVEINNTFYRLPGREMLLRWADEVPAGFAFVLKASQRITHRQRLSAESKETVDYLFDVASALGGKLGPVLFQTPPFLRRDIGRLRDFLGFLPAGRPVAFEFRHETWRDDEVYATLKSANAALVCADTEESGEAGAPIVPTADWGYLRLRRCDYDDAGLAAWAARIRAQPWRKAFVFFKHDEGDAAGMALKLLSALASIPSRGQPLHSR
ncbi:MAG TPA: DUF72 domain-containing protein [Vicinamibacteria bacterium]|nr:DUF72 domain-containing protein [Vicinamibacteria bacterium]